MVPQHFDLHVINLVPQIYMSWQGHEPKMLEQEAQSHLTGSTEIDRGRREERRIVSVFFQPTCHGDELGLKETQTPWSLDPHQLVRLHDLGAFESAQGYPNGP